MGKFKISGTTGNYRFNLHASNGKIVGRGTQGYATKENCKTGIASVKRNADAEVIDLTNNETGTGARYEIFLSSEEYWFRLFAVSGEEILCSEGYTTKENCENGIESVKDNAPAATIEE